MFGVFYWTKQPDSVRFHVTSDRHHRFVLCSLLRAPAYSGLLLVLWSRTDLEVTKLAGVSSCWRAIRSARPHTPSRSYRLLSTSILLLTVNISYADFFFSIDELVLRITSHLEVRLSSLSFGKQAY